MKRYIFALLIILQVAIQSRVFTSQEVLAATSRDDTYYYLQIALNAHDCGFITFDCINSTNGVQFAWFWIMWALAGIFNDPISLLYAAKVLAILINALSYVPVWYLPPKLSAPAALGLFYVQVGTWVYLTGMENSLHLLIMLSLLASLRYRSLWIVAVIGALAVWTRLDSVIVVSVVFVWSAVAWQRDPIKPALFALSMGALQALGFYLMGGYPLPVSGLIKQFWYNDAAWVSWTLKPLAWSSPLFSRLVDIPYTHSEATPVLLIPLVLLVLISIGVLLKERARLSLFTSYIVGLVAWYIYITGHNPNFSNYLAPASALGIILFAIVAHRFSNKITFSAYLLLCLIPLSNLHILAPRFVNVQFNRYEAALYLHDTFPPDTLIASYNAGVISYFSQLDTINLDGLVNSHAYYRQYVLTDADISDYLAAQGVQCVADLDTSLIPAEYPLIDTGQRGLVIGCK